MFVVCFTKCGSLTFPNQIHSIMTIERRFDIPLIAALALKEKQIQQNYRPIIAVHKWFARRPGTLFRGLLLSEFCDKRLDESYFEGHDFAGKSVADPFMGGGTPLLEANRVGCDVQGFDINPMSAWIVREEIEHLDLNAYRAAASGLVERLAADLGELYRTDCPIYGDKDVPVKYFLWVKTTSCETCGQEVDLFPGYRVSEDARHPKNVLVCGCCGELNEVENTDDLGSCVACKSELTLAGPAKRGSCGCPKCGSKAKFPKKDEGPLGHRLFAIEYFNPLRKRDHKGRFFKKPDAKDLERAARAKTLLEGVKSRFIPTDEIPAGDETDRLHRWGYKQYHELFNARQLLGLELSCQFIASQNDLRIKHALATNLSDLLRYQNMLCRYDTMALKSLDVFSVHGFPVGLVVCESNLLGVVNDSGGTVGSGGWINIIDKYAKAKAYCDEPFEVLHRQGKKVRVPITGEWIGESRPGSRGRAVSIRCASATEVELPPESLDAVFTDPPYFGNVQYAELMDFCYVWLRRLVGTEVEGFARASTRASEELTVNLTEGRGLTHFTEGMAKVYSAMARALKPGAPFAFTYHHNKLEAYLAIAVAILDAGLVCTASLPCPAEMGGSIHIQGTGSSIVDTVFVCRHRGTPVDRQLFQNQLELNQIVRDDLAQLRIAGLKPTDGDIRCIVFGHQVRMAIWNLHPAWNVQSSTDKKLDRVKAALNALGSYEEVITAYRLQAQSVSPGDTKFPDKKDDRDAVAF